MAEEEVTATDVSSRRFLDQGMNTHAPVDVL